MRGKLWIAGAILSVVWLIMPVVAQEKQEETTAEATEKTNVDSALVVRKISFEGMKDELEAMLRAIVQTPVGKEISQDLLTKDIKNLYKDTGLFADVIVAVRPLEDTGLEVVFLLEESPKVETIDITGNEKLKYKKVKEGVALKAGQLFNDKQLWESEQGILKLYREAGYYLADVKSHVDVDESTNTALVTFEIAEGERVKVTEVNFAGNANIPSKTLLKEMKTSVGKHFDEGYFEQDLTALTHYYQDQGFAKVRVSESEKRFSDDETGLILNIEVDEGPQFIISEYKINIKESEKPAFTEEKLQKMLTVAEGDFFNRGAFQENVDEIRQAYLDKGYLLAEVTPYPKYDENEGVVEMNLEINEGDVIIIDQVRINGLEKTKDNVIRRELNRLDIKPGEFFDVQALRKARQRIFQMGPFIRNVDFVPSDTEGSKRDLIVNLTETPRTGLFSLGGGYGTEGGLFGVAEIGENNLFGRAFRLNLKGEIGASDRHTGELRFSTPWLLGTPTRLSAAIYDTQRVRRLYGDYYTDQGYDRYVYRQRGGSITIGRPIFEHMDWSVRLKNEAIDARYGEELQVADRTTRSITLFLSRDTRDYQRSLYEPISGSNYTTSYEYSGGFLGADNKFRKYTAEGSWFFSVLGSTVFAAHVRGSYLNILSAEENQTLFFERYLLGGIDTVRGYEDYEILPDNNNFNGGNKTVFANFEYRIPLASQLSGVVFFDIGQVWDETTSNILDELNPKKGAGIGIRFDLMGMLARLEWGYGFDREINGRSEPRGKLHFSIGPGF